jgi:hypothetical protein
MEACDCVLDELELFIRPLPAPPLKAHSLGSRTNRPFAQEEKNETKGCRPTDAGLHRPLGVLQQLDETVLQQLKRSIKIRPHRRDESWSASLWQTFFSTSMGAQIPAMTEKPLATSAARNFT